MIYSGSAREQVQAFLGCDLPDDFLKDLPKIHSGGVDKPMAYPRGPLGSFHSVGMARLSGIKITN
jgi:hypothetical protein